MKYIHTFWSKPLFENKFNEFNISLDTILLDYAFSVDCIHKIDHKIVLFADEMGAELLSFIPYDEVHIVEIVMLILYIRFLNLMIILLKQKMMYNDTLECMKLCLNFLTKNHITYPQIYLCMNG